MRNQLYSLLVCLLTALLLSSFASGQEEDKSQLNPETKSSEYAESSLRRFEIIFIVSLPFTTIHSYLIVRGAKMIQARKVSPNFSKSDWKTVGIGALGFSAFIGFWDWLHTHKNSPSQPRIPNARLTEDKGDLESLVKLEIARIEF